MLEPSAPAESLVFIKEESFIAATASTEKIEKDAAKLLNPETIRMSLVKNERIAAYLWLTYIFMYWTLCVWGPIITKESFYFPPSLICWCFGTIGIMASSYLLQKGNNPSGNTEKEPTKTNGSGRISAVIIICAILIDLIIRVYDINNVILPDSFPIDITLITSHTISIFWCSFFFYGRFKQINPEIATVAFVLEWIDIIMSIIAFGLLTNYYTNCVNNGYYLCLIYFLAIPIKIVLWILPMMIIKSWGTKKNAKDVSMQLFISNILTDLPIFITILQSGLYTQYIILLIDLLLKSFILIQGISYYLVFNIWLNRGFQTLTNKSTSKKTPKSKAQKKQEKQNPASESEKLIDPKNDKK